MLQKSKEDPWILKVIQVPIPPELRSITFTEKDMKKWREFADNLKTGDFKQNVVNWCEGMQILMYKREVAVSDCYKRYIQAQHPNKRIKIKNGRVVCI